jgi:hypothetical protein
MRRIAVDRPRAKKAVPVAAIECTIKSSQVEEFGILLGRELTVDPHSTSNSTLDTLTQRLHAVFRAARTQALAHSKPVGV